MGYTIFSCLAVVMSIVSLQASADPLFKYPNDMASHHWVYDAWTASDKPYQAIENIINGEVKSGVSLVQIQTKLGAIASAKLNDPYAQFAWAYAVQKGNPYRSSLPSAVCSQLGLTQASKSYLYARLRFLITYEASDNGYLSYLAPLGKRLLKRNPHDEDVRIVLIDCLLSTRNSTLAALPIALAWEKADPHAPAPHAVLAGVYSSIDAWSKEHDPKARSLAIAQYKAYLHVAPPNDHFIAGAKQQIKALQEETP